VVNGFFRYAAHIHNHGIALLLFEVVFSGCLSGMRQICRPLGDLAGQIAEKVI